MKLTKQQIQAILDRANAATPGPWDDVIGECIECHAWTPVVIYTHSKDVWSLEADRDFLIHTRVDVPQLCEALLEANAEIEALREQLETANDIARARGLDCNQVYEENSSLRSEVARLETLCRQQEQHGTEYAIKVSEENARLRADLQTSTADELRLRSEVARLRAALESVRQAVGTSTEAGHIADAALEGEKE